MKSFFVCGAIVACVILSYVWLKSSQIVTDSKEISSTGSVVTDQTAPILMSFPEPKEKDTSFSLSGDVDDSGVNLSLVGEKGYYPIAELGIAILMDKFFIDDVGYVFDFYEDRGRPNEPFANVGFFSRYLGDADEGCNHSVHDDALPLGSLSAFSGSFRDDRYDEYISSRNPIQFDGFFLVYFGPQALCRNPDNLAGSAKVSAYFRFFDKNNWLKCGRRCFEVIEN